MSTTLLYLASVNEFLNLQPWMRVANPLQSYVTCCVHTIVLLSYKAPFPTIISYATPSRQFCAP